MSYKVKEVSDMVGVSVRTLHHYDEIGLLNPSTVTPANYRLYSEVDLERLQQILYFKELDFSLQEIKNIIDDPNFDKLNALKSHKKLLEQKKIRLEKIICSVDQTINSIKGGIKMKKEERFKAFDMTDIEKAKEKYKDEAERLYGEYDTYKESQIKTSKYKKEDWAKIQDIGNSIYYKLAEYIGTDPGNAEVQALIKEYHSFINDYFYTCPIEVFLGLGELYIADERFTKNIDKHGEGLAQFLSDGIKIYGDSQVTSDKIDN